MDIFAWTWNFRGGRTESKSKQQKWLFAVKNFFYGNDFDAVLVISRSYRFGANAFKPVEKIAAGMKKMITNAACEL